MSKIQWKKKWPIALSSLVVIVLLVALDQWTKASIVSSIPLGDRVVIIPHFFDLTYVQNTGAAFSMFAGMGMWFFLILTLAALAAMVWYFFKTDDIRIEWCLGLIAAGAIGNLIDRMTLGYVRDFFLFYIFGQPFPVFNVADICVSCGFILLVLSFVWDEWEAAHGKTHRI